MGLVDDAIKATTDKVKDVGVGVSVGRTLGTEPSSTAARLEDIAAEFH
jgi:hypothetical protein